MICSGLWYGPGELPGPLWQGVVLYQAAEHQINPRPPFRNDHMPARASVSRSFGDLPRSTDLKCRNTELIPPYGDLHMEI